MEDSSSSRKSSYDPGWNDPPTFSFSAQQTTPNRPRNFLNKRVAFPMSGGSPSQPNPLSMPPMQTTISVLPPSHTKQNASLEENTIEINSEETMKEVKIILLAFLENSSELGPKALDIRRRIDMMEEMWLNGKLNKQVHLQMKELAYALRDDQPSKADDIHRALMVDHVNFVRSWMPGVKQLVHHCIARSELLSLDKE